MKTTVYLIKVLFLIAMQNVSAASGGALDTLDNSIACCMQALVPEKLIKKNGYLGEGALLRYFKNRGNSYYMTTALPPQKNILVLSKVTASLEATDVVAVFYTGSGIEEIEPVREYLHVEASNIYWVKEYQYGDHKNALFFTDRRLVGTEKFINGVALVRSAVGNLAIEEK